MNDSNLEALGNDFVDGVLKRGWVPSTDGNRVFGGAINMEEAHTIMGLIIGPGVQLNTLEFGVANGLSTLAMVQAVSLHGGTHVGVDPCQYSDHSSAALELLKEFNLSESFNLKLGPSHLEAPKLLEQGKKFDVIFIDGHHNYDYKLLDFFYADKLLNPDGYIVFHDILLQSTKKVYRFIKSHHKYEKIKLTYKPPTLLRRVKYIIGAIVKRRSYWYWWPENFRNLLVLKKLEESNHHWDYYKNF